MCYPWGSTAIEAEIPDMLLLVRRWLKRSTGKGKEVWESGTREAINICLLAEWMGVDVLPTFGGDLELRSPEVELSPCGLVPWVPTGVMASWNRKSQILMKWLF